VTEYLDINRTNWDERAAVHAASPEYGLDRFVADPAAEAPRVAAYDEGLAKALESGDPGAVAALDVELGLELAAEGAGLWPALASASRGAAWRAGLLWSGSPYGVAWFVAQWQRDVSRA
jgi:hypothetical protein